MKRVSVELVYLLSVSLHATLVGVNLCLVLGDILIVLLNLSIPVSAFHPELSLSDSRASRDGLARDVALIVVIDNTQGCVLFIGFPLTLELGGIASANVHFKSHIKSLLC